MLSSSDLKELLINGSRRALFTKYMFDGPGLLSAPPGWARLEFGESPDSVQNSCPVGLWLEFSQLAVS